MLSEMCHELNTPVLVSDSVIKLLSYAGLCVGFVFSYFTFCGMFFDKFLIGLQRSVYFVHSCFDR